VVSSRGIVLHAKDTFSWFREHPEKDHFKFRQQHTLRKEFDPLEAGWNCLHCGTLTKGLLPMDEPPSEERHKPPATCELVPATWG
jgi:hypothetical protein